MRTITLPKVDNVSSQPANEMNSIFNELMNFVEDSGQSLDDTNVDLVQMGKGAAIYAAGGNFYTDSGTANAYVLSVVGSKLAPPAYFNGMQIRFFPGNANNSASTVNVASLGLKNLKLSDGSALPSGTLSTSLEVVATYNGTHFVLSPASSALVVSNSIKVISKTVITSTGTYTPPANLVYALVEIAGGGGGGGGAINASSSQIALAGGGGGGGYSRRLLTAADIGASQTVTIGAGGTAGANTGANGGNGGASSFGALLSANGGQGGIGQSSSATSSITNGGPGGTASSGDVNIPGQYGFGSFGVGIQGQAGAGGSSQLSAITPTNAVNDNAIAGSAGANYGGGGGGAGSSNAHGAVIGGVGAPGICIILEYCSQ